MASVHAKTHIDLIKLFQDSTSSSSDSEARGQTEQTQKSVSVSLIKFCRAEYRSAPNVAELDLPAFSNEAYAVKPPSAKSLPRPNFTN
jgi:hypothetical protein